MKRNFKFLFLILIVILLTGCSGNYNLIINDDLSIQEQLELSIKNEDGLYQKTLKIFEDNNIDKEKYNVSVVSDEIKIEYEDEFDSIEDYLINSKVYHQVFDNIEYNRNKNYIDLYVNENIKLKNNYTDINGSNLLDLDVIQINITNPFKVNFTNADIINETTYTWSLTKDDTTKKIQMQFKPNLNRFPYESVIVGMLLLIVGFILIFNLFKKFKSSQNI